LPKFLACFEKALCGNLPRNGMFPTTGRPTGPVERIVYFLFRFLEICMRLPGGIDLLFLFMKSHIKTATRKMKRKNKISPTIIQTLYK